MQGGGGGKSPGDQAVREVKYASIHPPKDSIATPQRFSPVHSQQRCEPTWGRCSAAAGARCRAEWSRAKGSRSAGEGLDLPVHPQHRRPPWMEGRGLASVGRDREDEICPVSRTLGVWGAGKGRVAPLELHWLCCPTEGTAASGETRASWALLPASSGLNLRSVERKTPPGKEETNVHGSGIDKLEQVGGRGEGTVRAAFIEL